MRGGSGKLRIFKGKDGRAAEGYRSWVCSVIVLCDLHLLLSLLEREVTMKHLFPLAVLMFLMAFTVLEGRENEGLANTHSVIATCISLEDFTCSGMCAFCHTPSASLSEFYTKLYQDGDAELCKPCHVETAVFHNSNFLSYGNHPSQIVYNPQEGQKLKPVTSVPLFCAGGVFTDIQSGPCKMLCSTCHDAHKDSSKSLRIDNNGSAWCKDCHDL